MAVVLLTRGSDPPGRAAPPPVVPTTSEAAPAPEPETPPRLAIGLAEQNPHLIDVGEAPDGFAAWRDRAAALRPRWFRVLVDWSKLQPTADAPPNFDEVQDGCLRGAPPCAAYNGLRERLRALRRRAEADGGWRVIMSIYGAPAWAREPAAGCPPGGAIRGDAYIPFVRSVARLAAEEGVEVAYWSPWNEPNHPTFLAPQRAVCERTSPALSPAAYARLVRAARVALPEARLMIGEVAGYDSPRSNATGAAEFAAALPRDVACAGDVWAQHAYVGRGQSRLAADRERGGHERMLGAVKAALDAHRCPSPHRIWITETGAQPSERACSGMDEALRAWEADDRVDVAIQYTFREDSAFRVGLSDTALTSEQPAYAAWLAWGGERDPDDPPPPAPCQP